jgi:transcriptional regulator with XRE-family HTH domain
MKKSEIIKRLKEFMESVPNEDGSNMSVRQFAAAVGVNSNKLYVTLRGETLPTLQTLMEIKEVFPFFNVDYIMTGKLPEIQGSALSTQIKSLESSIKEISKELHETKRNLIFANSIIDRRGTDEDKKLMGMVNFNDRVSSARSECKIIPLNADYFNIKTA